MPVSVPYSSTCSRTTSPSRFIPSRMSSTPTPEKFSRIDEPPRPSTYAARPGTNATWSSSPRASRSVVSMKSGSVAQMNSPPCGMGPLGLAREVLGEPVEHHVAPAAIDLDQRPHVVLPRAGLEVRRDEVLGDRRRAQVGRLLAEVHLRQHRRRRHRPPQADPGGEDLRERARVDDELLDRASAAWAAARPRSGAGRRGCPRARAARARTRSGRARGGARAKASRPPGCGSSGPCR